MENPPHNPQHLMLQRQYNRVLQQKYFRMLQGQYRQLSQRRENIFGLHILQITPTKQRGMFQI